MKWIVPLLLIAAQAQATPFAKGDADAGLRFFVDHDCNQCHRKMMGGDGSRIFTRFDRKVHTPDQLVDQMRICTGNVGITLQAQDEQNLGAYLNTKYYHFH